MQQDLGLDEYKNINQTFSFLMKSRITCKVFNMITSEGCTPWLMLVSRMRGVIPLWGQQYKQNRKSRVNLNVSSQASANSNKITRHVLNTKL